MRQSPEKGGMGFNKVAYAWVGKGYAQKVQGKLDDADTSFRHAAENDLENKAFQMFNQRNNINETDAVTRKTFKRQPM